MEEIFHVASSHAVVSDGAMVVHVVDASATATAVMNTCVLLDHLTLWATVESLSDASRNELFAWQDIAWIRVMCYIEAFEDLHVEENPEEAEYEALGAGASTRPSQIEAEHAIQLD